MPQRWCHLSPAPRSTSSRIRWFPGLPSSFLGVAGPCGDCNLSRSMLSSVLEEDLVPDFEREQSPDSDGFVAATLTVAVEQIMNRLALHDLAHEGPGRQQ